jgi:hypothetical protein
MARRGQKKLSLQPGNGFATPADFLLSLIPRAGFAHGESAGNSGAEFGKGAALSVPGTKFPPEKRVSFEVLYEDTAFRRHSIKETQHHEDEQ